MTAVGTIDALWRYPVKSMLGERVAGIGVNERGLAGDRGFALMDRDTGKVASAKNPRLWRGLLSYAASLSGSAARITGPKGKAWWSIDADIDDALSAALGRSVGLISIPPPEATLDRSKPDQVLSEGVEAEVTADIIAFGSGSPAGTFFDFAPIHLITTSTLDKVASLHPNGVMNVERYRPNLVIATDGEGFVENEWVDRQIRIGDDLTLRVVASTPRCAVPTLVHGTLPRDTDALRTLAKHNRVPAFPGRDPEPCAGVYAQVLRPGRIRAGDTVHI